ncbi:MAG TPA: hypothetical protein VEZ20_13820 [Allosphingosinicella sp.]|nr:hypothetical protein [Allosphingosinicella sp.]
MADFYLTAIELLSKAFWVRLYEHNLGNARGYDVTRATMARKGRAIQGGTSNGTPNGSCLAEGVHFCVHDPSKLNQISHPRV